MECVINDVFKSYPLGGGKAEKVLNGINLKINAGRITSIFGPSGCGKSTLLHIISGLDTAYEGSVAVGSAVLKELSKNKIADFRRDHIGFVFQSFNLLPHLKVKDNLLTALYLKQPSVRKRTEKITRVLSDLEIPELQDKKPNELSGGQRQRVAIARALMNDPDLIIADEPTGALDIASQKNVLATFRRLSDQGKTIIIVTHNPEVGDCSDTIVHMRDGQLIDAPPPAVSFAPPI